jgi:hypothetical protein
MGLHGLEQGYLYFFTYLPASVQLENKKNLVMGLKGLVANMN